MKPSSSSSCPPGMLDIDGVCRALSLCRSAVHLRIRRGLFPPRRRLIGRRSYWLESDVATHLDGVRSLSNAQRSRRRFTDAEVLELRRMRREEDVSYGEIGRRFGVRGSTIRAMALGITYKDVPGAITHDKSLKHGELNGHSRLTDEDVILARRLYRDGECSQGELARRFGVANRTMRMAIVGLTWKHLPGAAEGRERHPVGDRHPRAKLTAESVRRIRKLRAQGATLPRLARRFGVSPTTIYSVCRRRTWGHIV